TSTRSTTDRSRSGNATPYSRNASPSTGWSTASAKASRERDRRANPAGAPGPRLGVRDRVRAAACGRMAAGQGQPLLEPPPGRVVDRSVGRRGGGGGGGGGRAGPAPARDEGREAG